MQIAETNLKFAKPLVARQATRRLLIHHSVSPDVSAAKIHSWHLGRGWSGIGYHYVIRANGTIERGRPEWAIGAHAEGANSDSIGIVLTGNFMTGKPTAAQLDALVVLVKDIKSRYMDLQVLRHCDVNATACPGTRFPWVEFIAKLEDESAVDDKVEVIIKDKEIPGKLIDGETWVPLRKMVEMINYQIGIERWNEKGKVVKIE